MQATLSARSQSVLDLVPRQSSQTTSRSTSDSSSAVSPFAARLSDARSARSDDQTKPTPAAESAASSTSSKPSGTDDAKSVDKSKSRDDASGQSSDDDTKSTQAADAKSKAAKKADAKDDADEADEADDKAAKPATTKKVTTTDDAAAADAAANAASAPTDKPVAKDAKPAKEKSDGSTTDEVTAAALAAAQGIATGASAAADAAPADGEKPVDSATDSSSEALAKAVDASAKLKGKTAADGKTDGKSVDAKVAATDASKVPAALGAPSQDQPEKESKKDDSAKLAAGDKDPTQSVAAKKAAEGTFDAILAKLTPDADAQKPVVATPAPTPQQTLPPEQKFAADNTDNVVSSVRTQLNANGNGQMKIRLDPPELGALEVAVKMVNGKMTASFTTNNDEATQLLSHSLSNLKTSLESSGISVDRIQVRQAPAGENAQQQPGSGEHRRDGGNAFDQQSQRGDQNRKEAVQKMWRKLAYGSDELDFVA